MPLHDWNEVKGWEGVHTVWLTELLRWIKPRLPEGYRAYIGSAPMVAIGEPEGRPDLSVRQGPAVPVPVPPLADSAPGEQAATEPDDEGVAVATLDPSHSLFVARGGWLVAAIELISPRNKDRHSSRALYASRYAGYLVGGIHLLLVDVHPRPYAFSFADEIARELEIKQPRLPSPLAAAYRVGEPAATGGSLLAWWRRPLKVGEPLPTLPLPLNVHQAVNVDLEQTYVRAAEEAYLT